MENMEVRSSRSAPALDSGINESENILQLKKNTELFAVANIESSYIDNLVDLYYQPGFLDIMEPHGGHLTRLMVILNLNSFHCDSKKQKAYFEAIQVPK